MAYCAMWGAPGSLRGPFLFLNIYINDITLFAKNMQLRLLADDTTGYWLSICPTIL